MNIFTIFYNPLDYPSMYVVRRFYFDQPTKDFFVDRRYEAVRDWAIQKIAEQGQTAERIGRDPTDDPKILESWI